MTQDDIERLYRIAEQLTERAYTRQTVAGEITFGLFSLEPENEHSNKKEFLEEKSRIVNANKALVLLVDNIWVQKTATELKKATSQRIRDDIDAAGRKIGPTVPLRNPQDFLVRNALDHGLSYSILVNAYHTSRALSDRLKVLEDQEKEFWSGGSRPPNYYARTIALRLARFYARETGKKPPVGVARDGGHPSTSFTKALEQFFQILGIKSGFRRPAQWAVEQLTGDDLESPSSPGLGTLGPFAEALFDPDSTSAYAQLAATLAGRLDD